MKRFAVLATLLIFVAPAGAFGGQCLDEEFRLDGDIAVWMSCEFLLGFLFSGDEVEVAAETYSQFSTKLIPLFENGHLSGSDFFEAAGWKVAEDEAAADATNRPPLIKILNVGILSCSDRPTDVCLAVWVTPYESETGWGSFDHFLVTYDPGEPQGVVVTYSGFEI